jgi:hypothetical protein
VRASLDSLSFMPLLQTDSNGGVIVTDWYTNPRDPNERMKVSVSILDQDLRADALRVTASRQVARNGGWIDAPVQAATVQKLEDVILTKARDLRRQACPARSDCLVGLRADTASLSPLLSLSPLSPSPPLPQCGTPQAARACDKACRFLKSAP